MQSPFVPITQPGIQTPHAGPEITQEYKHVSMHKYEVSNEANEPTIEIFYKYISEYINLWPLKAKMNRISVNNSEWK